MKSYMHDIDIDSKKKKNVGCSKVLSNKKNLRGVRVPMLTGVTC